MRTVRFLLLGLLAAVLVMLGGAPSAHAYTWSTVTVDGAYDVGRYTSIAVDANGDPMISYYFYTDHVLVHSDLKFAICDSSASANRNCDQPGDWRTVTADGGPGPESTAWPGTAIAVDAKGDPMIAYPDSLNSRLKFAICDMSASTNGNCDQSADWSNVTLGSAQRGGESIAVGANGDPVISYPGQYDVRFTICDMSASTNGNCDQASDWSAVVVDAAGDPDYTSIAVDASGDPVISYWTGSPNYDLRFAICDMSASTNGNCDQAGDWRLATVDGGAERVGNFTSIAVEANGDIMISYYAGDPFDTTTLDLRFAICDISASANGNCNQTGDWSLATVDGPGDVGKHTSITVDPNGDPMISYLDATNGNLKFAVCDMSASANGNCDQTGDWNLETVDTPGSYWTYTSIAVDGNGAPVISYYDYTNEDLKFATASLPDSDRDGIPNPTDNCPDSPNPGQENADGDPYGDACDNCPNNANPNQENSVHPGTFAGDHCEDPEPDGVFDITDNCPDSPNPGQENADSDQRGDACDNCASTPNPGQENADGDQWGDACDNCASTPNPGQENADGDTWGDACENCPAVATVWWVPVGDDDCDGWSTADENVIGTDPNLACGTSCWPADMNDNQVVNLSDLLYLAPPVFFSVAPGSPYDVRYDLNLDGVINLSDILYMAPPVFFATCTP